MFTFHCFLFYNNILNSFHSLNNKSNFLSKLFNKFGLIFSLLFSFNMLFLHALKGIESNVVATVRVLLMVAALALLATFWKKWKAVPFKELMIIALAGFLNFGLYSYTFAKGLQETSATQGAIIFNTSPIFSMLFAVLYKLEKWSWSAFAGAMVALGGVAFASLGGAHQGSGSFYGDALVLFSAMVLALGSVMVSDIGKKYHPAVFTALLGFFGLITLIPFSFIEIKTTPWLSIGANEYLMLAFLGLIGGAAAFGAYFKCLSEIGASTTMIYSFLITPLTIINSIIFFGQGVHHLQVFGAIIVLAGAGWSIYQRNKMHGEISHIPTHH